MGSSDAPGHGRWHEPRSPTPGADTRPNSPLMSSGTSGALESLSHPWHVRRAPDVSFLERPGVDRVAVANELEQVWFAELLGGPLVHPLQPRSDHRVVEHPAEALFVGDVGLDVSGERIAVGEHTAE